MKRTTKPKPPTPRELLALAEQKGFTISYPGFLIQRQTQRADNGAHFLVANCDARTPRAASVCRIGLAAMLNARPDAKPKARKKGKR